jgi:uncharacterized coiled-coil DUF342 family protein
LSGCGKKADENRPISEVKAEAERMSVADLRSMAMQYKDSIMARQKDLEELTAKLKDIPIAQMVSAEAKELKAEVDNLNKSISALKERFQVYYQKLKDKGGDLSGLEI